MISFRAEVFQNEFVPANGTAVDAIISVTGSGLADTPDPDTEMVEIVIIDISGSMSADFKLEAAKRATAAAIDSVRDGVRFAVIAGNETAKVVFPRRNNLAVASESTRVDAKRAIVRLDAEGGTAIGMWLARANELFSTVPDAIRHVVLLTDGQNSHEAPEHLQWVLGECADQFQCDCRGVGTDWKVEELRQIATVLLGTVDIIPTPAEMADEFRALIDRAMCKGTTDVMLDVWTPLRARVVSLSQVAPSLEDLTSRGRAVDDQCASYPTGAWGTESRDYHLRLEVPPHAPGEEMLAARVQVLIGDHVATTVRVRAVWTADLALSTRVNREVAHYTGQAELASAIQAGLDACATGDQSAATTNLARAYELARASGHDDTLRLLERVVEVDTDHPGTVRLRREVAALDEMTLNTRSTKTVRVRCES